MSFAFIDRQKAALAISSMCRILGVSQSAFFACRGRPASQRQRDDIVYLAHNRAAFKLSTGTYGSPRMPHNLKADGHAIGRRRVARLIRENDLVAR